MKFHFHGDNDGQAFLKNTGHTAEITFQDRKIKPYISGGHLDECEKYVFEQTHFHWGKTDKIGSEHTIDGKR